MPSQDDAPGNASGSSRCASPRVSSSADVHSNAASRRRPHSCQSIGLTPAGIGMAKPCEAAAGKVEGVLLDTAPSAVSMRRRFSGVEGPWNGARRKDGPANCLYDMPDDPSPGTLGYKNTTGDAERFTAAVPRQWARNCWTSPQRRRRVASRPLACLDCKIGTTKRPPTADGC